jgi:hypothetical protein
MLSFMPFNKKKISKLLAAKWLFNTIVALKCPFSAENMYIYIHRLKVCYISEVGL